MARLIDILGSKKCMQILKSMAFYPDREFYQSEIAKKSGLSVNTAKKWLDLLVKYNVLDKKKKAGHVIFSLRREHPFVKQLKILLNVSRLYEAIRTFSDQGFEAYLFGSAARGEDDEKSDIDLLIIGRIDNNTLAALTHKINESLDREVNPVRYDPMEYAGLSRKDKAFYENLERDRIRLI